MICLRKLFYSPCVLHGTNDRKEKSDMFNRVFLKELWDLYQQDFSPELSYKRDEEHRRILKKFGEG